MKTLADLKRNAHKYTWEQYFNSWLSKDGYLKPGDKLYGLRRKVVKVQSNSLGFENGTSISWLEWPKAKELSITDQVVCGGQLKTMGHGEYIVTITPIDIRGCALAYHLRPITEEVTK